MATNRGWLLIEMVAAVLIMSVLTGLMTHQWITHLKRMKRLLSHLEKKVERDTIQSRIHLDIVQSHAVDHLNSNTLLIQQSDRTIKYSVYQKKLKRQVNQTTQYLSAQASPESLKIDTLSEQLIQVTIEYPQVSQSWLERRPHATD